MTTAPLRTFAWLALPGLAIVGVDVALRFSRLAAYRADLFHVYLVSCLVTIVLWGGLTAVASSHAGWPRWPARVLLVLGAILTVGGQVYFRARYGAYVNHRAVVVGMTMLPSVGEQLWSDRAGVLATLGLPALFASVWPMAIARWAPSSPSIAKAGLDIAVAALAFAIFSASPRGGDEQQATPDVLYFSAMGDLASARWRHDINAERVTPGPRSPLPVPRLTPAADAPQRNVVLIVTESVRATDTCLVRDPSCRLTPFTDELLPRRAAFTQMRSLASTTAISLAVLWSGLPADASRKDFHEMPLVWEYAAAAGFDTAYWTAQNLFFGNAGVWLDGIPARHRISATQLVDYSTYEIGADDSVLVDHALGQIGSLRAPYLAVVHLSNTHAPYLIDPKDAPFQPQALGFGSGPVEPIHNRYRDAIHRQDKIVARFVRDLRARAGDRTVVVFTSDHGEQMRERGALTHTTSLIDPEIRVPFWIDAPPGTLTANETAALEAQRDAPRTTIDVLPTLLDLMGVWDAAPLSPLRAKMLGESLLRGGSTQERALVLSNCTELFACAVRNWGAIRGTRKLLGTQSDPAWRCYDVAADPDEIHDLGAAACGDLKRVAETGRGTPF